MTALAFDLVWWIGLLSIITTVAIMAVALGTLLRERLGRRGRRR